MKCLLALALVLTVSGCAEVISAIPVPSPVITSTAGTHVRLMRGLGGAALSPGVDQIATLAAKVPGVTLVRVYEYTQAAQIAAEVSAEPLTVNEVIGGYSCGANSSPVAAADAAKRRIEMVTVIQASLWCGGTPLTSNVMRAQETYNPNCLATGGLGCKELDVGPGFNPSNLTIIVRPDCHPCADVDPDAQNDMILAIRSVANAVASQKYGAARGARVPGAVNHVTRYRGQPLYH